MTRSFRARENIKQLLRKYAKKENVGPSVAAYEAFAAGDGFDRERSGILREIEGRNEKEGQTHQPAMNKS